MGIGDTPSPVASGTEIANPLPKAVVDEQKTIDDRLTVLERTSAAELVRQIEWLYDYLGQTYPPP